MLIIGFDPGLTNTGYAVLRKKNNDISLIAIAEKYLLSFVNTRIFNGEILTCFAFEILLITFLVLYLFIKKPKVPLFIP